MWTSFFFIVIFRFCWNVLPALSSYSLATSEVAAVMFSVLEKETLNLDLFEGIKVCAFGKNEHVIHYPLLQRSPLGAFTSITLVRLTSIVLSLKIFLGTMLNWIKIFQYFSVCKLLPLWCFNFGVKSMKLFYLDLSSLLIIMYPNYLYYGIFQEDIVKWLEL